MKVIKGILALTTLVSGLMGASYTCEVYEITLEGKSYHPENLIVTFSVVSDILYTQIRDDIHTSMNVPYLDGKTEKGVGYRVYRQSNGFTTVVYDDFKEGVYTFTSNKEMQETLVNCKAMDIRVP